MHLKIALIILKIETHMKMLSPRHKSRSYSSYEDDIDTNRILIQKSTMLKGQTIEISRLR